MSWTTPRTWVDGELPDASTMNAHVRDNLNEMARAKVAAAEDVFYRTSTGLGRLAIGSNTRFLTSGVSAASWGDRPGVVGSGSTALSNKAQSTTGTWEQWGTEEISVADPGYAVTVLAWLSGTSVRSGFAAAEYRLRVSLDGGSTWTESPNLYNQTRTSADHQPCHAIFHHTGTPTGAIKVQAEVKTSTATVNWDDGRLMAIVLAGSDA